MPQGQSPSAEETQSISDLIDVTVANLRNRNIAKIDDVDYLEDEFFIPLGHIVAAAAAPEFGQEQNQAIWALKERAELDLKYMYDNLYRLAALQHAHRLLSNMQKAVHWLRLNKELLNESFPKTGHTVRDCRRICNHSARWRH